MIKAIIFTGLTLLASLWLSPFIEVILQAKGTFIYFFNAHGIPIGWLGFTALFTAVGFSIIYGFLNFFID